MNNDMISLMFNKASKQMDKNSNKKKDVQYTNVNWFIVFWVGIFILTIMMIADKGIGNNTDYEQIKSDNDKSIYIKEYNTILDNVKNDY